MKKKIVSAILCAAMVCSSMLPFNVYAFADTQEESQELEMLRYDNPDYEYRETTYLEITEMGPQVVLTWPAVDKDGNLINANPLRSTSDYGNPTAGYTNVKQGMIIEYNNWTAEANHGKPLNDKKSAHNVLFGLTDKVTDYPVVVTAYDKDLKEYIVGNAYIDTNVVATSLATAYLIQYSEDGKKWKDDHPAQAFNHGRKLTRASDDEKGFVSDGQSTFFLENQITEALNTPLESGKEYYIRVIAYDESNAATKKNPFKIFEKKFTPTYVQPKLNPAFPSVEGGGSYSQGGRGGDVYVVTNLTDDINNPQPGSLRYGLKRLDRADKNGLAPRTIVFAVGGTIHVDPTANKSSRKFDINSNTTIAGQTAPGNGITIAGASAKIDGENIIVRYMRFRLGEGYDMDSVTPTGKNIVIDHCSMGWGVDEIFSPKEIINSTVQWSTITEGLSIVNKNGTNNTAAELNSAESEVKHGMGGIWNGYETTFHHNLLANCGTRNPRFEGGFGSYQNRLEYANNVVYNWQHNSGYGGERASGNVNFRGNYYQPGPDTQEKVIARFFEVDGTSKIKSSYYIEGNVMMNLDGTVNKEVTDDNTLGFTDLKEQGIKLEEPVELTIEYTPESAYDAFEKVVNTAGASKRRDAQDARLFNDIRNNTGFIINSEKEAGGYDEAVYESNTVDTDMDGMPDEWETAHKLNPNSKDDAGEIIDNTKNDTFTEAYNGYSNIEAYINELAGDFNGVGSASDTSNPDVKIANIDENMVFMAGKAYELNVEAKAKGNKSISKVEFYIGDEKQGEFENNKTLWTPKKTGRYILLAKAYDSDNMQTFSKVTPVYVLENELLPDGFTVENIMNAPLEPHASAYYDENGKLNLAVLGSGMFGNTSTSTLSDVDKFTYVYIPVKGDVELSARVKDLCKIDTFQKAGVMIREKLAGISKLYMPTLTLLKGENYEGIKDVAGNDVKARNIVCYSRVKEKASVSFTPAERLGLPVRYINEEETPAWVKVKKEGNKVTAFASTDGEIWYVLREFEVEFDSEEYYVGFAVEGIQNTQARTTANLAIFSNILLNGEELTADKLSVILLNEVLNGDMRKYNLVKKYDGDNDGIITANDAAIFNR